MKSRVALQIILFSLVIANVMLIWSFSFFPINESAEQSGGIVSFLIEHIPFLSSLDPELLDHIVRKLAHFCEFGLLGVLSASFTYSVTFGGIKDLIANSAVTALCCLSVASTDEMIQAFTARGNQVTDVLLDFSGSVTGIIGMIVIFSVYEHIKNKRKT